MTGNISGRPVIWNRNIFLSRKYNWASAQKSPWKTEHDKSKISKFFGIGTEKKRLENPKNREIWDFLAFFWTLNRLVLGPCPTKFANFAFIVLSFSRAFFCTSPIIFSRQKNFSGFRLPVFRRDFRSRGTEIENSGSVFTSAEDQSIRYRKPHIGTFHVLGATDLNSLLTIGLRFTEKTTNVDNSMIPSLFRCNNYLLVSLEDWREFLCFWCENIVPATNQFLVEKYFFAPEKSSFCVKYAFTQENPISIAKTFPPQKSHFLANKKVEKYKMSLEILLLAKTYWNNLSVTIPE